MAELKERAFTVNIVDSRGSFVNGTEVQILINGVPKVQRHMRRGKAFITQLSEGVEKVEVRVTVGGFLSREEVKTDVGTYTVTVPDQYIASGAAQLSGGGSNSNQTPAGSTKTWVAVLSILVPALMGILVAYWQFVYKPHHKQNDDMQIGIFVMNAMTGTPIQNARVILAKATQQEEKLTDSLGTARFVVTPDEARSLRVEANVQGYIPGSREIDASGSDKRFYVLLSPQSAAVTESRKEVKGLGPISPVTLAGTWEVVVSGNINDAAVKKGTFDFSPQHNGSILVEAHLDLADQVKVTGTASMRNSEVFLSLKAANATESWQSEGELQLSPDRHGLAGRITSKKGDDMPVTLRKL